MGKIRVNLLIIDFVNFIDINRKISDIRYFLLHLYHSIIEYKRSQFLYFIVFIFNFKQLVFTRCFFLFISL